MLKRQISFLLMVNFLKYSLNFPCLVYQAVWHMSPVFVAFLMFQGAWQCSLIPVMSRDTPRATAEAKVSLLPSLRVPPNSVPGLAYIPMVHLGRVRWKWLGLFEAIETPDPEWTGEIRKQRLILLELHLSYYPFRFCIASTLFCWFLFEGPSACQYASVRPFQTQRHPRAGSCLSLCCC